MTNKNAHLLSKEDKMINIQQSISTHRHKNITIYSTTMESDSLGPILFLTLLLVLPAVEKFLSGSIDEGLTVFTAESRNSSVLPLTPVCLKQVIFIFMVIRVETSWLTSGEEYKLIVKWDHDRCSNLIKIS